MVKEEYKALMDAGIEEYLHKLGLMLDKDAQGRTGGRYIEDSTLKQYEVHYRGLEAYCAMVGDYE